MPYLIPRTDRTVLDSSGAGRVSFQVEGTARRWLVDSAGVSTDQTASAPVPVCLCDLDGVFMGGTRKGNMDTASGRVVLFPGSVLTFTWSGGVAGSTATATIEGTFDRPGTPLE